MGGRTASSGFSSGGAGATKTMQIGDDTIEFSGKLNYGKKDPALQGDSRKKIEEWENKRRKNKIEYATALDKDGEVMGEAKGGKGSVRPPLTFHFAEDSTFSHNHPRENGMLGGTFSKEDMHSFAVGNNKTFRATAKEGTYSISKTDKFDSEGFNEMVRQTNEANRKTYRQKMNEAREKLYDKNNNEMTYDAYKKETNRIFNDFLVDMHEAYRANQKTYGYTYTLEKIT